MPVKLIVFDLDGVLTAQSRDDHYNALNRALATVGEEYVIGREEHLSTYDGLSTTKKLNMLTQAKGLPRESHDRVWTLKQKFTHDIIDKEYTFDERLRGVLRALKEKGYTLYVASNSINDTVKMILLRKGLIEYIDFYFSNEEVKNPKPNPEIYLRAMARAGVSVQETIIIEDSHVGRQAATGSGAHLLPVENPTQVTLETIEEKIGQLREIEEKARWEGFVNVVIPMAGRGSRFADVGYTFPKTLIEVHGRTMIEVVVRNLGINPAKSRFIFIVRQDHLEKYALHALLRAIAPGCVVVPTDGVTEGAACSILLAEEHIDNDDHLLLANSDQYLEWDANEFMHAMTAKGVDGGISTFTSRHPKWSFARLDKDGFVAEVAEKNPISDHATTGIYYFNKGSDFVRCAKSMIEKNVRTNGEFYTCPVYNELIQEGGKVRIMDVQDMHGIGVPEDLDTFLRNFPKERMD
jgi:HAD superfamily hydrolase (TIGR01509 family)